MKLPSEIAETEALRWLGRLGTETQAFEVRSSNRHGRVDWKIALLPTGAKRPLEFLLEVKSRLSPRDILVLKEQAGAWQHSLERSCPLVVCSPVISSRVRETCRQAGLGYLDAAGNCRLVGEGFFLQIEGRVPIKRPTGAPDLFAVKSSRIVRVLLGHPRSHGWQIQELAREARVSLGLASRIANALVMEAYTEIREGLEFLRSPGELLEAWQARYEPPVPRRFYVMDSVEKFEESLSRWAAERRCLFGLTGLSGAWRVAPMARRTSSSVCFLPDRHASLSDLVKSLHAKEVDEGANLSIFEMPDEGAFFGLRSVNGLPVVSPVQLYLDLKAIRGRGAEAADEILREELEPLWNS